MNKRLIKSNDEGGVAASFNTVLYTGNGSTQSITGVGFEPDFVWIKNRDTTTFHALVNSVVGENYIQYSNSTSAGETNSNILTSLDSDGFTVGIEPTSNGNNQDLVAWCWKAGGAAVTNTDGSTESQVSANTEAGFSIVSWNSGANGTHTIGHGLNDTPKIIITKDRDNTSSWIVWSTLFSNPANDYLYLNSTNAKGSSTNAGSVITNTTFNTQTGLDILANADAISYCFAEVAGFSKFGSYVGTGLTDNFVSTSVNGDAGFEPAFLLVKQSSSPRNWYIVDNKRNPSNPKNRLLMPNLSDAEFNGVGDVYFDFNSNGFTVTAAAGVAVNQLNETYIYMAFANQF